MFGEKQYLDRDLQSDLCNIHNSSFNPDFTYLSVNDRLIVMDV